MREYHFMRGKFKYAVTLGGCWKCLSHSRDKNGYPMVREKGKATSASRYVYDKLHGKVPDGMVVMHSCDNPSCINPGHLMLGTQADNMSDRDNKGRGPRGSRNGRSKLTEDDVASIRKTLRETLSFLAAKYEVEEEAIADIATRKLWRHVA